MRRKISSKSIFKWQILISFCFILNMATDISHAAGLLMRIQQMKKMRQQPTQAEYEQYQQQQGQAQGQQGPAQSTYQQTVDQRNQAIAQAILNAHNQSGSSDNVPFGNEGDVSQSPQQATAPGMPQKPQVAVQAGSTDVKDVVDLSEVWKKLDTKSTVWTLLIDDQAKLMTVSEYIDRFQKQGVKINESPAHYVQMIDQVVGQNPQMLNKPFGELIQILAIIDYDFDNGISKDVLARKILGEAGFEANKKRFSQPTQQQQ